ncbi:MAG TPA: hypothetical protein VLB09_07720, partial [Nitrospiria bacterium]|nr:hypothetical protein [Nitrospiria bacterium]
MTQLSEKPNIHWPSTVHLAKKYSRLREKLQTQGSMLSAGQKKEQKQDLAGLSRQMEIYRRMISMDRILIEEKRTPSRMED